MSVQRDMLVQDVIHLMERHFDGAELGGVVAEIDKLFGLRFDALVNSLEIGKPPRGSGGSGGSGHGGGGGGGERNDRPMPQLPPDFPTYSLNDLKRMPAHKLLEIADKLNLHEGVARMRKQDVTFALLKVLTRHPQGVAGDGVLEILPEIVKIGVSAIKVEGRQRSPAYVAQVTRTLRAALDERGRGPEQFKVKPAWQAELGKVAEGTQVTLGAYNRPWR